VKSRHHLSNEEWSTLGDSDRLVELVEAAKLRRIRTGATKRISPFVDVKDTPIGTYANGIVPAGDRYLLVVGLASGMLGRIDLETKRVRAVSGVSLPAGDGLARSGRTLYGVNSGSRITQVKLSRDWLHGTVVRQITNPSFHLPTTMQILPKRLMVVNSQFDARPPGTPTLPRSGPAGPQPSCGSRRQHMGSDVGAARGRACVQRRNLP